MGSISQLYVNFTVDKEKNNFYSICKPFANTVDIYQKKKEGKNR